MVDSDTPLSYHKLGIVENNKTPPQKTKSNVKLTVESDDEDERYHNMNHITTDEEDDILLSSIKRKKPARKIKIEEEPDTKRRRLFKKDSSPLFEITKYTPNKGKKKLIKKDSSPIYFSDEEKGKKTRYNLRNKTVEVKKFHTTFIPDMSSSDEEETQKPKKKKRKLKDANNSSSNNSDEEEDDIIDFNDLESLSSGQEDDSIKSAKQLKIAKNEVDVDDEEKRAYCLKHSWAGNQDNYLERLDARKQNLNKLKNLPIRAGEVLDNEEENFVTQSSTQSNTFERFLDKLQFGEQDDDIVNLSDSNDGYNEEENDSIQENVGEEDIIITFEPYKGSTYKECYDLDKAYCKRVQKEIRDRKKKKKRICFDQLQFGRWLDKVENSTLVNEDDELSLTSNGD
ncbi:hypothetical protein HDU92_004881 [Lobulomyces angularis]|nr:hypothetical protein HDU92_004881 [Lobulomyces angularis]